MGQNHPKPVPPVNIQFNPTTKIGILKCGEFTYQPKWDPIGFDPQPDDPQWAQQEYVCLFFSSVAMLGTWGTALTAI